MFDHQKLSLDAICSTIDLQQSLCIYFLIPVVLTISHKPNHSKASLPAYLNVNEAQSLCTAFSYLNLMLFYPLWHF